MRTILFSGLFLLLSGCANVAISPATKGKVTDINGKPLSAKITITNDQLKDKQKYTHTDKNGYFSLGKIRVWTPIPFSVIRLESTVEVSSHGYKPVSYKADGYETIHKDITMVKE